ncbi:TFIIB-type zinc ribbon-containing protein [Hyalangium versicolor]|uniref:TFIIB-type zinc ribbon-containing protein n=1 Tax=Hyalangium versicolor TaxID=2861190 RepID=UPI001CCAE0E7|nr:zf-TFIIB domain-containing protein [Hyalangium versicolor]
MSACPFCQERMRDTFHHGLAREECEACGAVWIEGEFVAKLLGGAQSATLPRRAKGQPGVCKGCSARIQYVPNCPECGLRSSTCPRCGTAPLAVLEAFNVKVDVCDGCGGVALDAGELEQLHEAATVHRDDGLPPPSQVPSDTPTRCLSCKRKLKPEHAFVWEGRFYCGSCAPEGAAPFTAELTRARPTAQGSIGAARLGDTPTESALVWLFSKIFS